MTKIVFMLTLAVLPEIRTHRNLHARHDYEHDHQPDEGCPINGRLTENGLSYFDRDDKNARVH